MKFNCKACLHSHLSVKEWFSDYRWFSFSPAIAGVSASSGGGEGSGRGVEKRGREEGSEVGTGPTGYMK